MFGSATLITGVGGLVLTFVDAEASTTVQRSAGPVTRILDATWALLNGEDGHRTRMADVARAAGLSRQAVYLHFSSRAELLIEAIRHIDEVERVASQQLPIHQAETGIDKLHAFVEAWGSYIPLIYGAAKTLLSLRDSDPDAARAWTDRMEALRDVCEMITTAIHDDGRLAEHLTVDEATDLLWAAVSIRQWELLTVDRGMSQDRFIELTKQTLRRALTVT